MTTTGQEMKRSAAAAEEGNGDSKKSRSSECEPIKLFDNAAIAPCVMEFLDTISLARFTQTNQQHRQLLGPEVTRRKAKIVEYENQVKALVGCHDTEPAQPLTRKNVADARKIIKQAKFLLNGEGKKPRDPFFAAERTKFKPPRYTEPRQVMSLLPGIFYTPSKRDPTDTVPTQESIDMANHKSGWLWGAEDHGFDDPFYQEIMLDTAAHLAASSPEDLEAFRKSARTLVYRTKFAMKCMQHTLKLADQISNSVADKYWIVDVRSSNNITIQIKFYTCLWSTLIYSQAPQCTMPRETLLIDFDVRLSSPCQTAA